MTASQLATIFPAASVRLSKSIQKTPGLVEKVTFNAEVAISLHVVYHGSGMSPEAACMSLVSVVLMTAHCDYINLVEYRRICNLVKAGKEAGQGGLN